MELWMEASWCWTAKLCAAVAARLGRGDQCPERTHPGRRKGGRQEQRDPRRADALLDRLELDGAIALMDALHTQTQTARRVVQEGGGDSVLFVKGNQPGLLKQAQHFLREDFSPSTAPG
jgi:hypothetical protein